MTEFPLPLGELFGHWGSYAVYALVGVAFGWVLESAGFGNSKKLAAQFYFKDLTVFKVMFTAIIVAMTLIFLSSAAGLLDYNLIWVPPTYLWPGIVGGLIMGVGFIVGGYMEPLVPSYPDQRFAVVDSVFSMPYSNVAALLFRADQASFLAGYVAARISATGAIGVYGGRRFRR